MTLKPLHKKIVICILLSSMVLGGCQGRVQFSAGTSTSENDLTKTPTATPKPSRTATQVSTPTPTSTVTRIPELQVTPDDLDGLTVSLWHPWTDISAYQIELLTREFNEDNEWGITVETNMAGSNGELYRQIAVAGENGELPDIVVAPTMYLIRWQAEGEVLVNLDDYIYDNYWGLSEQEVAVFPRTFWDEDISNGLRLGLPAQRSFEVIFYNQTWAEELGYNQAPATPEEFQEQACAAAQSNREDNLPDNDGTGGWIVNARPAGILGWLLAFEYEGLPENETDLYEFSGQEAEAAFVFLRSLIDEECAWISRTTQYAEYFNDRYALFYSGQMQDIVRQERDAARLKMTDDWTILSFPSNDEKPIAVSSGLSYGVFDSTPEQRAAAWIFVRWLVSPENQSRLVQVNSTLPLSSTAIDILGVYGEHHPAWQRAIMWIPVAHPVPALASWREAGVIIGDAAWQLFQPHSTIDDVGMILEYLEETIDEVLTFDP
jgi:multiple sugar transport system substrate-binding protein